MVLNVLVVAATGGLGQALVKEAESRGHRVSVLVRNRDKLNAMGEFLGKVENVVVGDATDPVVVSKACDGVDVVLLAVGAKPLVAKRVSKAYKTKPNVTKLVFVAGATNLLAEDGITPYYKKIVDKVPHAEAMYKNHQACIDAVRSSGITYVGLCPAWMRPAGGKSSTPVQVTVNRPAGDFLSYEDAAVVMLLAAESKQWDHKLISAATPSAEQPHART